MLRCDRRRLAGWALLAAVGASTLPATAQVQRFFPPEALRGVLQVTQAPEVLLNGQADRLAPGARIRGADNMMAMSASITGLRLLVHYTREPSSGLLRDVWILTEAEAAQKPWPTTPEEAQRWSFDRAAQAWTRR